MNSKHFMLLFFGWTLSLSLLAQQRVGLSGTVVDSEGTGLMFINVALVQKINQQQKIIAFTTSNIQGQFHFASNYPKGNYSLQFSGLGYTDCAYDVEIDGTTNDLGNFIIQEGVALSEVVVSARRQIVRAQVDRLVYDVSKDSTAAHSSILQILDKIPFIQIDPMTKQIKVMGQDRFVITVNGKKNLLLSEANQYVQEILKAGNLKEIELITSPDGRHSGQTVINFVAKSSLPDGFAARVGVNGHSDNTASGDIGLSSKIGRLIFDLSGSYRYSDCYGSESWANMTNFATSDYRFMNNYTRNKPGVSHSGNVEFKASYDFNPHDLLTFQAKITPSNGIGNMFSRICYFDAEGNPMQEQTGNTQANSNSHQYIVSLNHQHSFKDKPGRLLTFTYRYDTKIDLQTQDTEYLLDETLDSRVARRSKVVNAEHTAGMDFYNPLSSKQNYFVTGKYVYRPYVSEAWQRNVLAGDTEMPLNIMDYIQQMASAKASYTYRDAKWMVTAEMAGEYTHNNIAFRMDNSDFAKSNYTWLAVLRFTYRPTAQSNFNLILNRSTTRPEIYQLNPYEDHSVPGQISKGNPDLDNTQGYMTSLRYNFFLNKDLNVSLVALCGYSDNAAYHYTYVDQEGLYVTTYANGGNSLRVSFNILANYNPFSWLRIDLMSILAHHQYEYPENRNDYWDQSYQLNTTVNLWKGGSLIGSIFYANPNWGISIDMQSKRRYMQWRSGLYLGQSFGKNWKLWTSVQNPWETYKISKTEDGAADFYRYLEEKTLGRTISLNATYTFGRFSENVKTSRRQVTNSDRNRE